MTNEHPLRKALKALKDANLITRYGEAYFYSKAWKEVNPDTTTNPMLLATCDLGSDTTDDSLLSHHGVIVEWHSDLGKYEVCTRGVDLLFSELLVRDKENISALLNCSVTELVHRGLEEYWKLDDHNGVRIDLGGRTGQTSVHILHEDAVGGVLLLRTALHKMAEKVRWAIACELAQVMCCCDLEDVVCFCVSPTDIERAREQLVTASDKEAQECLAM